MYKDYKIQRFELRDNIKDTFNSKEDFDCIDSFKNEIARYIYTDIKMTDWKEPIEKAFQSRLQILVSSVLLRALLLKDGLVLSLNNNNFPTYYATLKSFLEVPALLGYVVNLIYSENDYKKIIPKINQLSLGNKEAGSFSVGTVEAINVLTLCEKMDKVFKNTATHGENEEEREKILNDENILTTVYKDVCNFGHINHNAHLSVGILDREWVWRGKRNVTGYKEELYGFYMHGFTIAIGMIQVCCSMIVRNPKVKSFNLLESRLYL